MKRDFLEGLGLEKDVVEKIMKEHGVTVQSLKPADYDELKSNAAKHEKIVQDLKDELKDKGSDHVEENESLKKKVMEFEKKELKIRIARENDIPFELADRLSGETEEEMNEDAKKLAAFVSKDDVFPLKDGINNTKDPYEDMVNKL